MMKWTNGCVFRHGVIIVISASMLFLVGCATASRRAEKELRAELSRSGYSLYQPFRSDDYPATLFVYARNTEKHNTEYTLESWRQTFFAREGELFPSEGQAVTASGKITRKLSCSADLAAELLDPVIDIKGMIEYIADATIEFGNDQRKHTLTVAKLTNFRDKLQDQTKAALTFYKDRKQLDHVAIVMETLTVRGMRVNVGLKKGCDAKVSAEKFKALASVGLTVKAQSDGRYELTTDKPMQIGYKAMWLPESILDDVVMPRPLNESYISTDEVDRIKENE